MAVDMINQGVSKVTTVNNKVSSKPKADDKKPVSKTIIGASLVGLAALASVGIYLATKGKGKVKPQELVDEVKNSTNNTQLEELQKQANELKDKIGREYWNKLGQVKGFTLGRSPKDRGAYKELAENKKEMQELLDRNEPVAKEFFTKVRNSVKALQNDPEYAELRKLRHQCKKEHQHTSRLALINEVIYTKLNNGQKTPYFEKLGLSVEDAMRLIKNKSLSEQEVYREMTKNRIIKPTDALCPPMNDHFNLDRLFINGNEGMNALKEVQRARKYLDGKVAETTAQRIRDVRVNVAQEIRQSDDVKALKELNRQIAELQKQSV